MSLRRFTLNGIEVFRNKAKEGDVRHFCVDCARGESESYTLVPFLDGQLHAMLSHFGEGDGALISCDKCGEVISTYYPDGFWPSHGTAKGGNQRSLIFRKF
jgi:hypothetical protein